ncbi:hypothetical protein N2601_32405 (plasmid) [Rhizobium sp. CB3060]|uniref:hypothetical protein n=1 Tax=Rhizobium sp. CB3060 TaxID=3138255 RepID=UPI0021A3B7C3|nr:hypothetical protein [Rhizobium tropici]UWU26031.1 hypothetical protein N2601_32405 [Rhizobium tropici]
MLRCTIVLALGALLASVSGCAGHKELKAPCSAQLSPSFFSSAAYAAETDCGPLIRQDGVTMF